MFRCRKCQQEVPERNLIHTVDVVGRPLFKHECGGIVDLFTDVPQPKAITGRSSIICECGGSTWVRSQEGVSTCLYCGRQPVPATQGNLTQRAPDKRVCTASYHKRLAAVGMPICDHCGKPLAGNA